MTVELYLPKMGQGAISTEINMVLYLLKMKQGAISTENGIGVVYLLKMGQVFYMY